MLLTKIKLPFANLRIKDNQRIVFGSRDLSDHDRLSQLIIDVVPAVLDRHRAAALSAGNYRDRFTAVAAQREQKRVQLFIICFDPLNDVFFAFLCTRQIHIFHLIQILSID